ncbi:hypothetical protein C8J56DRAFT_1046408 [Mycena floridula]|nr:hypothetical protein C8J56DRAFT_1066688 [Mycena floridula]KAJ7592029.1 hypothetical protein C8J56DRAFT_1046408 [Mycena floridula]
MLVSQGFVDPYDNGGEYDTGNNNATLARYSGHGFYQVLDIVSGAGDTFWAWLWFILSRIIPLYNMSFMIGAGSPCFLRCMTLLGWNRFHLSRQVLSSITSLVGEGTGLRHASSVLAIVACSTGFLIRCYNNPELFWTRMLSYWLPALTAAATEWWFDSFSLEVFAFQLGVAYTVLA